MYEKEVERLQEIVDDSKRIVFLGGAGVSTESDIPDFRSSGGLFRQAYRYPPEEMVSHTFLMCHTEEFFEFYKDHMMYLEAEPNAAHRKLAEMEQKGKLIAVITQNIDGLHQAAGSKNVLELHGSIWRNYCRKCKRKYDAHMVKESEGIPRCGCGGVIRPDVVLYEEGLDSGIIERSIETLRYADTLIIGGTSLSVYPVAGFVDFFRGRHLVVINKGSTERELGAELTISAPIGEILSRVRV